MTDKFEQIQVLFQVRNARKRGPTSSDEFNDMLEEIAHDFSELNNQWNNRLVPLGDAIPDGTDDSSVDAYTNGLDGANLYVNHDATTSSNSLYYNTSSSRPNTVFEQFGLLYTTVDEIRDDLENQINNTVLTASQIDITDTGGLYDATNVEDALAEVKTQADYLQALDWDNVTNDILPSIDNYYSIGSPTLRFKNIYVAGSSLHIVALAAEAGGTARDYSFEVDSTDGALLLKQGVSTIRRTLYTGALQIPALASDPTEETGYGTLYVKSSDKKLYYRDDNGDITELGGGATQVNVLELAADSDSSTGGSYISMSVDGTEALRVDENQNVGIGTTTPIGQLHVKNDSWCLLTVEATTANTDPALQLTSDGSSSNNDWSMRMDASDSDKIQWRYDNVAKMTLDTSGNVGIGTTGPGEKLSVVGDIVVQGDDGWDGSGDLAILAFDGATNSDHEVGIAGEFGVGLHLNVYKSSGGGKLGTNSLNAMFIEQNTGNVGIGTTSPGNKLEVNGAITITSTGGTYEAGVLGFTNSNWGFVHRPPQVGSVGAHGFHSYAGADLVTIEDGGNVGIGTTGPSYKLEIAGKGTGRQAAFFYGSATDGQDMDIAIGKALGTAECALVGHYYDTTAADSGAYLINYGDNKSQGLFVRKGGKVGIRTSTPSSTLYVNSDVTDGSSNHAAVIIDGGTNGVDGGLLISSYQPRLVLNDRSTSADWFDLKVSTDEFAIGRGENSNLFSRVDSNLLTIKAGGNVGIGTTSPKALLGLAGSQNFTTADGKLIGWNLYYNAGWKYNADDYGIMLRANNTGDLQFYTAGLNASGADAAATVSAKVTFQNDGKVGLGTGSPTTLLDINADSVRVRTSQSPASNGTGIQGEIAWDANYIYVCTATNTWKRAALTGGY